ncbi:MAG: hypothetical protein ACTSSO_02130, partial [Candidatus Hodarchaeales archaeon]
IGTLLFIDLQNMSFNKIPVHKSEFCRICATTETDTIANQLADYRSLDLCGNNTVMVVPTKKIIFKFQQALDNISAEYSVLKHGKFAFTFQFSKDVVITIFRGGNALIRGQNSKESALILWEELKENKIK